MRPPGSLNNPPPEPFGILALTVGPLATNCYLLWDPSSRTALVVDPGAEADRILTALAQRRLSLAMIVNTHGHADHTGANGDLKRATGARLLIHPADQGLLGDPVRNLSQAYGAAVVSPPADAPLSAGQELALGRLHLRVLATPGHTPGSICLFGSGLLLSGDTLFAASVGRTDLPGGDARRLGESLHQEILPLPPETRVYPGHGPDTILAREIASNPFLKEGYFL
jgi:hydroxyacylglutathione hydrolase